MKTKIFNIQKAFYILLPALILAACNKQIDEIRPLTKIDKEGELASLSGIVETTVGNYKLLFQSGGFVAYDEPLEDISESRGNNVTLQQWGPPNRWTDAFFFQNSNFEKSGFSSDFYRGSYQIIVSTNTVLEGIANFEKNGLSALTDADKDKLRYAKGENIFLRALTYFNLVRVYGKPYYQNAESSLAVPIKLTSALTDVPQPATVKDVYNYIVTELQTAAQLMKAPVTKTNAFASKGAAWALLSRVYLYMGGSIANPNTAFNQKVVDYADSVINQTDNRYALLMGQDYTNMFAEDELGSIGRVNGNANKEIIFAFDNAATNSMIGELYHDDGSYVDAKSVFVPSADFKQLIGTNDLRYNFIKTNNVSGLKETTKYRVLNNAWFTKAPHIFLRMGEVYLNRAEAYAKLNNTAMAQADLVTIHTRAALPASEVNQLTGQDLMTAILRERRIELAFEGHNSYDYFRNGLPMTRIAADNNGTAITIQPTDPKVVFTIPNN